MASHIPRVSQLSKCVMRVLGCNPSPMTLQGTNTYIIGTGKRRLLLDTGESGNEEYLSNLCTVLKKNDIQLGHIVISHWHLDHIGGLKDVLGKVADPSMTVLKFPAEDDKSPHPTDLGNAEWLSDGQEINIEGASLIVHHTPGHTTDHVVLELKEEAAVFSGDCILGEGTTVFEDLYDYMKSLQIILALKPTVIYPGHGPILHDPLVKIQFYINHRLEREKQILEVLRNSPSKFFSPIELVEEIYKDTPSHLHLAAANNVEHHLQKLSKEKRAERNRNDSNLWRFSPPINSSSL